MPLALAGLSYYGTKSLMWYDLAKGLVITNPILYLMALTPRGYFFPQFSGLTPTKVFFCTNFFLQHHFRVLLRRMVAAFVMKSHRQSHIDGVRVVPWFHAR